MEKATTAAVPANGIVWLRIAVIYLILGVALGIAMGAAEDFTLRPVHAHLNLLGFTTLALAGLVYTVFPAAGTSRLARAHFWLLNLALPVMMLAMARLVAAGDTSVLPAMVGAEVAVALGVLAFAANLFVNVKG